MTAMLGARLRAARLRLGLTQEELAARVGGLTKAAVSNYECGKRMPEAGLLRRLARELGVRPASELLREPVVTVEWLAYRSTVLGAKTLSALEAELADRVDACLRVHQLVSGGPEPWCAIPPREVSSADEAEVAAGELRAAWGLGIEPVHGLVPLVERRGTVVIEFGGPPGFDGLSGWTSAGTPVVVLEQASPPERRRLSLAHELGHLLAPTAPGLAGKAAERLAFRFGASLIVPAAAARRELGTRRTRLSLDELVPLKRLYGLSVAGWVRRAWDVGIIGDRAYRSANIELRSTGLHRSEAQVYPYEGLEHPEGFRHLVARALAEGLVSDAWAARHLPELGIAPVDRPLPPATAAAGARLRALLRLPRAERQAQLAEAAAFAAKLYAGNPDMLAFASLDGEPFDGDDEEPE
ncbi:MAG: helix-turn-helix domain-containing protein [Armatimonadetes bacterium]|nr:helix-turn-helix domain-containing protein [Armatimonadota bacterium]